MGETMIKINEKNIKEQLKYYYTLLAVLSISIIIGIVYTLNLDSVNSKIITDSIYTYFNDIRSNTYNAFNLFINTFSGNTTYVILIWLLGISIIGIPIIIMLFAFKSFLFSFSIISILKTFGLKGIFMAILYVFPFKLLFILGLVVLTYYSLNFAFKLLLSLFKKKTYSLKLYMTKYIKVLLVLTIISLLDGLYEGIILPKLIILFNL